MTSIESAGMSTDTAEVVCAATIELPGGGPELTCTLHFGPKPDAGWHRAYRAPYAASWPAAEQTCRAWKRVPTAQGSVIVFCGAGDAAHDRHEGCVGIFPVRWQS